MSARDQAILAASEHQRHDPGQILVWRRPEQGRASVAARGTALYLEQLDRFVVGGQTRLGIKDTRDLLCVLYSIGARSLETSRGLRRDVAQPDRGHQYQPIHALRVMDAE